MATAASNYLPFAPLVGGLLLFVICSINIIRNPQISNGNAALLAFGALLFAAPTFANFKFSFGGLELSAAQKIGDTLNVQGADIKLDLADIKKAIASIANKVNAPTPAARSSPALVVLVYYVPGQQDLAQQIQNYLLGIGYAANATQTDFSEVKEAARGQPNTARLIYVSKVQVAAQALLDSLKQKFHDGITWSSASNDNLSAASIEIKVF